MTFVRIIVLCAACGQFGCDEQPEPKRVRAPAPIGRNDIMQPIWRKEFPAGIEWVYLFHEAATSVIVCDQTGAMDIINLASAKRTKLDASLDAPRPAAHNRSPRAVSSQPADQTADNLFYCFDSFTIAALDVEQTVLKWRVGVWPTADRQVRSDPESLNRLLAVHAAPGGALAARDDGAVGLLNAADGSTRWKLSLTPMSQCRIHIRDSLAALVFKSGAASKVALLDLRRDPPTPRVVPIGDVPPFWSAFTDRGLVLVWPDRIARVSTSGRLSEVALETPHQIAKATIRLITPPDGNDLLIFGDLSGRIHVYQPATDQLRPLAAIHNSQRGQRDVIWRALDANPEIIAAAADSSCEIYDARTGKRLGLVEANIRPIPQGLCARGRTCYIVGLPMGDTGSAASAPAQGLLEVWRYDADDLPNERRATRIGSLDHTHANVRNVLFTADKLLIVEQNRLSAYTLP